MATADPAFDAAAIGRRFAEARGPAGLVPHAHIHPPGRDGAYRVQDATIAALGAIGGWKVGAKGPASEPACSPLPLAGVLASGAVLTGAQWRLRGIEVEVAMRLGRDLVALEEAPTIDVLHAAVEAIVPAIEVVETRLQDWRESDPFAQMADLQLHGALVIGADSDIKPADVDLRAVQAYLAFDGQPVASTFGANPAGDIWRLLGWLAVHCTRRGLPLRAGDVVTTGSCSGMLFAAEGARVQAGLAGIGTVELRF